jgi:toxin ParE1/3/4
MRIRWTAPAARSLAEHITFIASEDPDAADRVRTAIIQAVELLADFPNRGRPGRRQGTREIVVASSPRYIVVYRVVGAEVRILRVWHGRQHRP